MNEKRWAILGLVLFTIAIFTTVSILDPRKPEPTPERLAELPHQLNVPNYNLDVRNLKPGESVEINVTIVNNEGV